MTGAVREVSSDVIVVSREKRNLKLPQRVWTINPIWEAVFRECAPEEKNKVHSESVVLNPE